jgi:conjugal transfer mating pair stabilization protein TraG
MYTVYSYWNFQAVIDVLNMIVLIMGGADYLGLVKSIAIAGLLIAVGTGMAKISAKEPMTYFIFLGIFYSMLFVPKVTVTVQDLRSGNVGTVANVPLGVGFFVSATSKIGKFLTETFETNFVANDALKFSNTGMAFGARAFTEMTALRIKDPKLSDAMTDFVRSCVNPEVLDDTTKYNQIANSVDVWSTIGGAGWLNPGRSVNIPNLVGAGYTLLPCIGGSGSDAYGVLTGVLINEVDAQQGFLGRLLNPEMPAAVARAAVATQLPDVESYMLGTSRTVLQQIRQGIMVNLLNDSAGSLAVARNDPSAVQVAIAGKMAEAQATSSYRTLAVIGESALPKFRNLLELVVIGVFPVVFLLIIIAGEKGGAVLKSYVMTAVWVQLWAPVYAIVNFMMQPGTAQRLQAALDAAASPTMLNSLALSQTGFKEASMAGALVFAVPVIAYALVKGGEVAMNGAMTGLTGPAKSAAEGQGGSAGVGNVNAGNTSWGNASVSNMGANKWDDNGSYSSGAWSSSRGDFAYKSDLGASGGGSGSGGVYGDAGGRVANMGAYSAAVTSAVGEMAQSQISSLRSKGVESSLAYSNAVGASMDKYKDAQRNSGGSTSVGTGAATGSSASSGQSFDSQVAAATKWADGLGLSKSQAFALTAGASLGFEGFAASASAKGMSSGDIKSSWSAAQEASQSGAFKSAMSSLNSAQSGSDTRTSADVGNRNSAGSKSSATTMQQFGESAKSSFQAADTLQNSLSAFKQGGSQVGMNLSNAVQQELGGAAGLEAATRPGNEGRMMAAVSKVADQVMNGGLGGYFKPSSGAAPQVNSAKAGEVASNVEDATGRAADLVAGGGTAVAAAQKSNAASVAGPSGAASVNGSNGEMVTPASVATTAGAMQGGVSTAVELRGTNTAQHAEKTGNTSGSAIDAAKQPGGLMNQTTGETAAGLGSQIEAAAAMALRAVAGNSVGSWGRDGGGPSPTEGKVTTPESGRAAETPQAQTESPVASQIPKGPGPKAPPPKWR